MGLGVIELAVIVAVVAIVARSAHGWRTGSLFGLGLLLFIGALAVGCADRSANNGAHVRTVDYSISEESAAAMSGFPGAPHSEAQFLAPRPIVGAELSWLGILLILVVAVGGVVLVRHRGAAGSSLAALVLLGFGTFMLLTLFWVRSSPTPQWPQMAATPNAVPVVVPNRFDAYESPDFEDVVELDHGRPMGEQQSEPIDELYERFSKPRIPLDEPEGAAEHAPAAATTAPPAAESAPQGAAEDPFAHEATSESDASDTAGAVEDEGAKDGPSQAQALVASAAAVADHAAEHDHDHADEGAVAVADAEDEPAQAHDGAHLSTPSAASADPHSGAATELPDWADQPTLVVGNVRRVTVEAGPYSTLRECTAELHREIDRAVHERVKMLVYAHLHRRAYVPELEWLPLEPDFALRECMTDHHVQHNETTMGRFMTCWALLEFTPEHDERLLAAWKSYARRDGIATTLVISLVVLSIVGGVWLLLKLDTWTRGYYSKRLFLGVPAVIIVLLLLAAAA